MPSGTTHSFLILRLSALGDVLHTLPAAAALRRSFPDARIAWVVESRAAVLLRGNPVVDTLYVIDTHRARRPATLFSGSRDILRLVGRMRAARFQVALDFQGLFKSAILGWLCGAPRRIGLAPEGRRERLSGAFINEPVSPPARESHVIALNNALVEACGASVDRWVFPLPATVEQEHRVRTELERLAVNEFVVLNPGAGWSTKRWPPARYAALARRIRDELGLASVISWGPGEDSLVHEIEAELRGAECPSFPTTFLELIPLLRRSRLFVGGDTGPMQLAAALGIPVVAIFGPTTPARNGPFSQADITLHRELFCSHCYLRKCPYHLECLEFSVDEVFQAVVRRLAEKRTG